MRKFFVVEKFKRISAIFDSLVFFFEIASNQEVRHLQE